MKQASSAQKTVSITTQKAAQDVAASAEGVALVPPAYGIDIADQPPIQRMADARRGEAGAPPANRTGLPDNLKAGIERLSGLALDDVRVHYNSAQPAQLQALAYTQGAEIHIGPRQERHLPHEAWHVVQQKQGRVKATMQMKGMAVNDDPALEKEADWMGEQALRFQRGATKPIQNKTIPHKVVQGSFDKLVKDQFDMQVKGPQNFLPITTVGFEHEFADMIQPGKLQGATHLQIAKSELEMPASKLPFYLETDADNALELVSPPFFLPTIDSGPVPDPKMVEEVDNTIKTTLISLVPSNGTATIGSLVKSFPAVKFALKKDVKLSPENMTPDITEKFGNAEVTEKELVDIKLKPITKSGAGISTQVNFATDAATYAQMQKLYTLKPGNFEKMYLDLEEQILGKMYKFIHGSNAVLPNEQAEYLSGAVTKSTKALEVDKVRFAKVKNINPTNDLAMTSITPKTHIHPEIPAKLPSLQGKLNTWLEKVEYVFEQTDASLNKVAREVNKPSPGLFEIGFAHDNLQDLIARIELVLKETEQLGREVVDVSAMAKGAPGAVTGGLDDSLLKLKEAGGLLGSVTELLKPFLKGHARLQAQVVINPNLRIFLSALARSLSGQLAVPGIAYYKRFQEEKFATQGKGPTKDKGIEYQRSAASHVKDVKGAWLKDTIYNLGLGILAPNDWTIVHTLVTNTQFLAAMTQLEPTLFSAPGFDKGEYGKNFEVALKQELPVALINLAKLAAFAQNKTETSLAKQFFGPDQSIPFLSHDPKWIGPRQDTYITNPKEKVQIPEVWEGKRLHVVETRHGGIETLKKLRDLPPLL